MKVTETGLVAYKDKRVLAHLLTVAVVQLYQHKLPVDQLEEGLRFTVATYLAAVPIKKGMGFRSALGDGDPDVSELIGIDEFIVEQKALIDPVVKDLIDRALGTCKDMGF
jgi:hypothetical protein